MWDVHFADEETEAWGRPGHLPLATEVLGDKGSRSVASEDRAPLSPPFSIPDGVPTARCQTPHSTPGQEPACNPALPRRATEPAGRRRWAPASGCLCRADGHTDPAGRLPFQGAVSSHGRPSGEKRAKSDPGSKSPAVAVLAAVSGCRRGAHTGN